LSIVTNRKFNYTINKGNNVSHNLITYSVKAASRKANYKTDGSKETKSKGKVIPLHAMEALGVRGGTASTHS
jgi:hypothetical protein